MLKVNRTHMKRIRNLVALCTIIAVILSVSTYAWFVGMRTVNVASFDVEIKSTDSLMLSLDGVTWTESVTLDPARANATDPEGTPAPYYPTATNNWPELIPVSTIGDMDLTASRMILFEKASFTPTKGGYRIMNSRVANDTTEGDGYVVFDLFIKNFSGKGYIPGLNQDDEEGIYLTIDSAAVVSSLGGVENTGIENSVRVAFAQIGRVKADTTTQNTVTGITCSTAGAVTGICRPATIWEPNDIRHVEAAISYYDTSCLQRTAATVADSSYTATKCATLADGTAYSTYAVRKAIASTDGVDIYDGTDYNGYTGTIGTDKSLLAVDTFTDSEKLMTGTARGEFMTLAANSITKVRVYIYIEGQDIDNYDFSSIGKKISINFGFTKERFTPGDIQYTGPEVSEDTQKPIISLKGASPYIMTVGGTYTEPGAIAVDNYDGDISGSIVIDSTAIQAGVAGEYSVTYTVTDSSTNQKVVTRKVIVRE